VEFYPSTYILPHKFVYEGNSKLPIRDSLLSDTFYGIAEGKSYKIYTVMVEDFYYDAHGRMNRIVISREFNNTRFAQKDYYNVEIKYSYDAKGNRQTISDEFGYTPSTVSYTNKPSLYSLHPV
jgi:hypothetical protein